MARLYVSRQELEKVFGGHIELGKFGIFVKDGGTGLLGDWTVWTGDNALGRPVVKKRREVSE
jgi:hypothetical protein